MLNTSSTHHISVDNLDQAACIEFRYIVQFAPFQHTAACIEFRYIVQFAPFQHKAVHSQFVAPRYVPNAAENRHRTMLNTSSTHHISLDNLDQAACIEFRYIVQFAPFQHTAFHSQFVAPRHVRNAAENRLRTMLNTSSTHHISLDNLDQAACIELRYIAQFVLFQGTTVHSQFVAPRYVPNAAENRLRTMLNTSSTHHTLPGSLYRIPSTSTNCTVLFAPTEDMVCRCQMDC
jgi:predicted XRE-type DNA-binding protein